MLIRPLLCSALVLAISTSCAVDEESFDEVAVDGGATVDDESGGDEVGGAEEDDSDEAGDFDDWVWDDESEDDLLDTAADPAKRVDVRPGKAQNAELIEALPVGRSSAGADRRIVMRLEPSDIPNLTSGDRLLVPAEVQVTTRCDVGQSAPGCNYSPKVSAQLILTGNRGDTRADGAGSKALSAIKSLSCSKAEHHCRFVFRPGDTNNKLVNGFNLPCVAKNTCNVNLVMWAWHPDARAGGADKLLIGENEGNYLQNGRIGGDKGRLMIVRERGTSGDDRRRKETRGGGDKSMPTNASPVVIYSHRLKSGDIKAGEQFVVEAKVPVVVSSRARFSTRMFVTKNQGETDGGGLEKIDPGQIGEHNGTNCTSGKSPCIERKVAVFKATGDIQGPVFVNIVAKSAVPGGGSARVTVKRNDGFLRSTRYRASLAK